MRVNPLSSVIPDPDRESIPRGGDAHPEALEGSSGRGRFSFAHTSPIPKVRIFYVWVGLQRLSTQLKPAGCKARIHFLFVSFIHPVALSLIEVKA